MEMGHLHLINPVLAYLIFIQLKVLKAALAALQGFADCHSTSPLDLQASAAVRAVGWVSTDMP